MNMKSEEGKKKPCCCEQPEKLQSTPEECTPEQIKECHGEQEVHPCCGKDE